MNRGFVCALLLAAALPLQAVEKIYRWVDADGGVHYSATPPPGQAVEEQDLRYQRNPDPAAAAAAQQRLQQDIDARREAEQEAAKAAAAGGKSAASRRERCAAARGIIARLDGARGTRYRREDGSYVRYTDDEWQQKMNEARTAEQQSCD